MGLASSFLGLALSGLFARNGANAPVLERERTALQERLIDSLRRAEPGSPPDAAFLADARAGLADLFAIHCAGSLPPVESEEGSVERLGPAQQEWILGGARGAGRMLVLPLVEPVLAAEVEAAERAAAIRWIGAVGDARDLESLLALDWLDGASVLERPLYDALSRAAGEILARDERAFAYLNASWRSLSAAELAPLILAMRWAPGASALEFLAQVIDWRPVHARTAMAIVQEIGRSFDPFADGEALRRIRPLLHDSGSELRRAAALALGALEDHESIPDLIELLEDDDGVRANAHWALRRITGLSLPASLETWERWHQLESSWIEREGEETFRRLRSQDAGEAIDAARAIATHPLVREELALTLVELLASDGPATRVLACRLIPDLGDARAFPGLLALLEDGDEEVSAAALEALRRMTGRDLPLDPERWQVQLALR